MGVTAMNHDPPPRMLAFQAANLTSINCINHPFDPPHCSRSRSLFLNPFTRVAMDRSTSRAVSFEHLQIQRLFKQAIHLADTRERTFHCRGFARFHRHHKWKCMGWVPGLLHDCPNVDALFRKNAGYLRDNSRSIHHKEANVMWYFKFRPYLRRNRGDFASSRSVSQGDQIADDGHCCGMPARSMA